MEKMTKSAKKKRERYKKYLTNLTFYVHESVLEPLGEDAIFWDQLERNRTHCRVTCGFS